MASYLGLGLFVFCEICHSCIQVKIFNVLQRIFIILHSIYSEVYRLICMVVATMYSRHEYVAATTFQPHVTDRFLFPERNMHLLSFKQSKMLCKCTLLFTFYNSYQCSVIEVILDFGAWSRVRTACGSTRFMAWVSTEYIHTLVPTKTWIHGPTDSWICGFMDLWIHSLHTGTLFSPVTVSIFYT